MGGIIDLDAIFNMFDLSRIFISDAEIIFFFFKAFGVVFAFLFFVYSIILARQTDVLKDTLSTSNDGIIVLISQVQLLVSVFILLYALFLI